MDENQAIDLLEQLSTQQSMYLQAVTQLLGMLETWEPDDGERETVAPESEPGRMRIVSNCL